MRTWFSYCIMKCCIFSKETVNSNPEVVSHGEEEAEKERDLEAGETCAL